MIFCIGKALMVLFTINILLCTADPEPTEDDKLWTQMTNRNTISQFS